MSLLFLLRTPSSQSANDQFTASGNASIGPSRISRKQERIGSRDAALSPARIGAAHLTLALRRIGRAR